MAGASCSTSSFSVADTDNDNRVSPAEFDRYMLEAIFAQADADGDGKVTFGEEESPVAKRQSMSIITSFSTSNGLRSRPFERLLKFQLVPLVTIRDESVGGDSKTMTS